MVQLKFGTGRGLSRLYLCVLQNYASPILGFSAQEGMKTLHLWAWRP